MGRHGRAHRRRPYQPPSNPSSGNHFLFLSVGEHLADNLGTRSHRRNGRGGACVPARTSAQRRFHPQRARSPPAKGAFPFINDACSHQNMFVHLPMNVPSWGDTGGHTGTAPTNLHQTSLPCNLLHLVHRQTILRKSYNTSHTRNGRGGACVPARTSAQRRFHP